MAQTYRTTRTITVRGCRYEKGTAYTPESEDEALQLMRLYLIERIHPPDMPAGKEAMANGGHH